MSGYKFSLAGAELEALGSGALFWPKRRILCVSDLHLGKSERIVRRSGVMLPPYDLLDTLSRLEDEIMRTKAEMIVSLGDNFDDLAAQNALSEDETSWLRRLQNGRRWVWIEGNHDPAPLIYPGENVAALPVEPLTFRHIPKADDCAEVAGHFHPKVQLKLKGRQLSKSCFLLDDKRIILPAFGSFTGGLKTQSPELCSLMQKNAVAIVTGRVPRVISMPRR